MVASVTEKSMCGFFDLIDKSRTKWGVKYRSCHICMSHMITCDPVLDIALFWQSSLAFISHEVSFPQKSYKSDVYGFHCRSDKSHSTVMQLLWFDFGGIGSFYVCSWLCGRLLSKQEFCRCSLSNNPYEGPLQLLPIYYLSTIWIEDTVIHVCVFSVSHLQIRVSVILANVFALNLCDEFPL